MLYINYYNYSNNHNYYNNYDIDFYYFAVRTIIDMVFVATRNILLLLSLLRT